VARGRSLGILGRSLPPRSGRGFSLVEALVAMTLLVTTVVAMLGVIPASYGYSERCATRSQAVAAGEAYLDLVRQYVKTNGVDTNLPVAPIVPIDPGYGFISGEREESPGNFSMSPSCQSRSLFGFDCTVKVLWKDGDLDRSVQVESYIASQTGF
jgi:Prokaryotic N-terminal methylation motif